MALNTLKSSADKYVEAGGWGKLDEMRKSYFAACSANGRGVRSVQTRAVKQKEALRELREMLDVERRVRVRLAVAYAALLDQMRGMAKNDPELAHLINRHVEGFAFKRLAVADTDGDDGRG